MRSRFLSSTLPFLFFGALSASGATVADAIDPGRDITQVERDQREPAAVSFAVLGFTWDAPAYSGPAGRDQRLSPENTAAWAQIARSLGLQKTQVLFLMEDAAPSASVEKQCDFFRTAAVQFHEHRVTVVPVPALAATVAAENAWRSVVREVLPAPGALAPAALGDNRHPADGLATDQTGLSFSFDLGAAHLVVINTDAADHPARAPVAWLNADLEAARARGAHSMFVLGHRPAFPPAPAGPGRPAGLDRKNRDAFWAVIERHRATYFCGGPRVSVSYQPRLDQDGCARQVCVGSGVALRPAGGDDRGASGADHVAFGWAAADVSRDGRVSLAACGFSAWVPKPVWFQQRQGAADTAAPGSDFGPLEIFDRVTFR